MEENILCYKKQLISKDQTLSVQEALNICRVHEASIHPINEGADIQHHKGKGIETVVSCIKYVALANVYVWCGWHQNMRVSL